MLFFYNRNAVKSTLIAMFASMSISYCQVNFFTTPIIGKKILTNSMTLPGLFTGGLNYTNQVMDNPYFKFSNKALSSRPSINFGLGLGVNYDSNKQSFKIELEQDEVGGMAQVSTISAYNPFPDQIQVTHYTHTTFFHQSSHLVTRLSLGYSGLITKQSKKNKIYFNADVSLLFGKNQMLEWSYGDTNELGAFVLYNDAEIKQFNYGSMYGGKSLMFGLGLSTDLGCKIKNKWRYFFSLNILYRQGMKTVQYSGYNWYIEDNGYDFVINYGTSSKGSGIYFDVSRRIPLKFKKERELRR